MTQKDVGYYDTDTMQYIPPKNPAKPSIWQSPVAPTVRNPDETGINIMQNFKSHEEAKIAAFNDPDFKVPKGMDIDQAVYDYDSQMTIDKGDKKMLMAAPAILAGGPDKPVAAVLGALNGIWGL